jgi:hypothetical protein
LKGANQRPRTRRLSAASAEIRSSTVRATTSVRGCALPRAGAISIVGMFGL